MKKLGIALFILWGLYPAMANNYSAPRVIPSVSFDKKVHDFGDIKQGEVVSTYFTYNNSDSEPLILHNVRASCGCTVPEWSRTPLMQNKSTSMKVVFNSAGKSGMFNKRIYIESNKGKDTLIIKGQILTNNN